MGDVFSIVGQIATLVAILGGGVAMYFSLRRPIERLDAKFDAKIGQLDAKFEEKFERLDAKIDRLDGKLSHEIGDFRLETQTMLARHDERLAAIERQRPQLQLR